MSYVLSKQYSLKYIAQKLLVVSVVALATGYAAQLRIALPWTPVPITLQTFVVLSSGLLLGKWWGSLSQLLYVSLGIVGVPFFSGMQGGLGVILGPRGGYLLGFVVTSFVVGHVVERYKLQKFFHLLLALMLISVVCIYGLGCLQLGLWLWLVKGTPASLYTILTMGMIPFIPGDLIKIFLVSLLARCNVKMLSFR